MNYIQYKLVSGEEIIAKVDEDEDGDMFVNADASNVIVGDVMEIIRSDDEGYRYYTFRPWMCYQILYKQLLNYNQVVGEALPDQMLMDQYHKAIALERKYMDELTETAEEKYKDLLGKMMEAAGIDPDDVDLGLDSDHESNVVSMFDTKKDRLH